MKRTAEATYLGQLDGWHRWTDGTALPVLLGCDERDDDHEDDEQATADDADEGDDEGDDDQDDEGDEERPKTKKALRIERQADRYRVARNEARTERDAMAVERDALRIELAFARAAGGTFVDDNAAWKLADRSLLSIGDDGSVSGAEEAVEGSRRGEPVLAPPGARRPTGPQPLQDCRQVGPGDEPPQEAQHRPTTGRGWRRPTRPAARAGRPDAGQPDP